MTRRKQGFRLEEGFDERWKIVGLVGSDRLA